MNAEQLRILDERLKVVDNPEGRKQTEYLTRLLLKWHPSIIDEVQQPLQEALLRSNADRDAEVQRAEAEAQRAEAEAQRAEAEARAREAEAQRAETEAQRAAKLAARLRALGEDPDAL